MTDERKGGTRMTDFEILKSIADWFDEFDRRNKLNDKIIQWNLRRIADRLEQLLVEVQQ